MCCKLNLVLSTSKFSLNAIVPMLLEHTPEAILLATTSSNLERIQMIIVDETYEHDYPIYYVQDESSIDELLEKMASKDIRVAIISTSNPLFDEMVRTGNGAVWYSACREGVFSYLEKINEYAETSTTIICFDNDESMIQRAKTMYEGTNIKICKAVGHSICAAAYYDQMQGKVHLVGGTNCSLFFPPEVKWLKEYLYNPRQAISKRTQLRFAETSEEFHFYILAKMIDVNAMHTLVCALAYVEGMQKGIDIELIPNMHFSELLEKDAIFQVITRLHSLLFDKYLNSMARALGEYKMNHTKIAIEFIDYLFSTTEEVVKRGLDYRDESYVSKIDRHFPLIRSVDDTYVNRMLDAFSLLF